MNKMNTATPFEYMNVGFQAAQLGVEANAVIWMRMMGMAGAWNTPFDEGYRMWREKPAAFTEAMGRGVETALRGGAPERVLAATIAPLQRDAANNRRRLADRGAPHALIAARRAQADQGSGPHKRPT